MAPVRKVFNPFYVLLLIVGTAFAITACAYAVMVVQNLEPSRGQPSNELLRLMDEHGFTLMMLEIGLLAVTTFAAIGTDTFWTRLAERKARSSSHDG